MLNIGIVIKIKLQVTANSKSLISSKAHMKRKIIEIEENAKEIMFAMKG
jgi:hypothetical protein